MGRDRPLSLGLPRDRRPGAGVVGLLRRYEDDRLKKKLVAGGRRGLTVPSSWRTRPGPVSPYDEEEGRWWNVTVMTADEARAAAAAAQQQQKETSQLGKVAQDAAKVVTFLKKHPAGETRTAIKEALGFSGTRVGAAVACLLEAGEVVEVEITKNGKPHPAVRLA